jgi:hypothetical protein
MGVDGTIGNQVRYIFDAGGHIIGYRNPVTDQDEPALSAAQIGRIDALLDGSGTDVALVRSFDSTAMSFTLDAGSGNKLPVLRATVQAPTDTIAGQRITSGGANTFDTTIDGNSTVGEVIAVSVGAALITQVHVGLSTGSEQVLDANGTVVAGELAKWVCDAADDCQMVYIRFAPPRGSGRYCDVSVVGKRRGG